jgi:type IV secretion system protein VirB11
MKHTSTQHQGEEAVRRQHEALHRALGHEVNAALANDDIVEVMLNPSGELWVDSHRDGMLKISNLAHAQALSIINTIASILNTTVTTNNPILECELPFDGSRVEALIPPVVPAPTFAIRKKAKLIYTINDYIKSNILSEAQAEVIKVAVAERKNILVAGGTGTGKTTFANAVLNEIANITPQHRIVIIEDVLELQCKAQNTVYLRTSNNIDQVGLLRATLRLRPDRIVVGEVRDKSALALLKAWNTGHNGGVGTVHANSTSAALKRIGQLIQEAGVEPVPELIAEAINIIVSIKRTSTGRLIESVAEVISWDKTNQFILKELVSTKAQQS